MYPCRVVWCWNRIINIVLLWGVQFSSPFLRRLHGGISWSSRRMFCCGSGSCTGRLLQVVVGLNNVLFPVTLKKMLNIIYRIPLIIFKLPSLGIVKSGNAVTFFAQNSKSCDTLLQNSTNLGMVILGPFF